MQPVFSRPLLLEHGLNGSGTIYTVALGTTVVIKSLSAYANSTAADIEVFLRHGHAGEALWRHEVPKTTANWGGLQCSYAFEEGSTFYFHVDAAPIDGADCFASGYVLTNVG